MSGITQYKTSLSETKSDLSDQLVSLSKTMKSVNAMTVATNFFSSDEWSKIKCQLSRSDYHSFANNFLHSIPNLPNYAIYDDGQVLYDKTNLLSKIPSNVKTLLQKIDTRQGKDLYSLDGYTMQAIGSTVIYSESQIYPEASVVTSIVGPSINGNLYTYNIQVVYNYETFKISNEGKVSFKTHTETQNPIILTFDTSAKTLTVTTFPFTQEGLAGNANKNLYTLPGGTYNASVTLSLTGTIATDLGSISFTPNSDGISSLMTITIPVNILINANVTKVYNYNGLIVEN